MLRKVNDKFQENLSRPGIIDARARYRAAARRLRNTAIDNTRRTCWRKLFSKYWYVMTTESLEYISSAL